MSNATTTRLWDHIMEVYPTSTITTFHKISHYSFVASEISSSIQQYHLFFLLTMFLIRISSKFNSAVYSSFNKRIKKKKTKTIRSIVFDLDTVFFLSSSSLSGWTLDERFVWEQMMKYPTMWRDYMTGKLSLDEYVTQCGAAITTTGSLSGVASSVGPTRIRKILRKRRDMLYSKLNDSTIQLLLDLKAAKADSHQKVKVKLCALITASREDMAFVRQRYSSLFDLFDGGIFCSSHLGLATPNQRISATGNTTTSSRTLLDYALWFSNGLKNPDETLYVYGTNDATVDPKVGFGSAKFQTMKDIGTRNQNNKILSLVAVESEATTETDTRNRKDTNSYNLATIVHEAHGRILYQSPAVDVGYHPIYKGSRYLPSSQDDPNVQQKGGVKKGDGAAQVSYIDGDVFSEALMLENDPVYAMSQRGFRLLMDLKSKIDKQSSTSNFFVNLRDTYDNDMDTSSTVLRVLYHYRLLDSGGGDDDDGMATLIAKRFIHSALSNVNDEGQVLVFWNAPNKVRVDPVVNATTLRAVLLMSQINGRRTSASSSSSSSSFEVDAFIRNQVQLIEESIVKNEYVKYYSCRFFALVFIMDLYCDYPHVFSNDFGSILVDEVWKIHAEEEPGLPCPVLEHVSMLLLLLQMSSNDNNNNNKKKKIKKKEEEEDEEDGLLATKTLKPTLNKHLQELYSVMSSTSVVSATDSSVVDYWKREAVYQKTTNNGLSYFGTAKSNVFVVDGLIDSFLVKALSKVWMLE